MRSPFFIFLSVLAVLVTGCETLKQAGEGLAVIGEATGTISKEEAESLKRTTTAVAKSFEDITPEQEYYIGRAVGATVLSTYRVYDVPAATDYLNLLGQTLSLASEKPETFGGYHFLILDSDEINAFAAPGGLIFISRGMLRNCRNEDAVAAVLAHEVGHVENEHGLKAIKKSRLTSALTILAAEGAKTFGGEDLAQLTEAFEGSISDITSTMMNSGYARASEREADASAVRIMKRVGYDPAALVDMLEQMEKNLQPGRHDFAATHPPPSSRIRDVRKMIGDHRAPPPPAARQQRFQAALGGI